VSFESTKVCKLSQGFVALALHPVHHSVLQVEMTKHHMRCCSNNACGRSSKLGQPLCICMRSPAKVMSMYAVRPISRLLQYILQM